MLDKLADSLGNEAWQFTFLFGGVLVLHLTSLLGVGVAMIAFAVAWCVNEEGGERG